MSFLAEGSKVSFVGDEDDGLRVGDEGKVLSSAGSGSHVLWSTGKRAGEISLEHNFNLVSSKTDFFYDDSLHEGQLVTIAVRDVYDNSGNAGLLNAMNDEGHLATFAPIAEEAIQHVAMQIRKDASIKEVLAKLDPDEGSEFVMLAANVLLRDAFGSGEE